MLRNVFIHKAMLADQVRMEAYKKAIYEMVRKGDVVADIGTGSGILAFFAVKAGASRAYAIERGDIIEEARTLAKTNGLAERITFIRGSSDEVDLPEKVDLIISEILGCFGVDENVLEVKTNFRNRYLKPGGRLVPAWIELYIGPVESEAILRDNIEFWSSDFYGLDFSSVVAPPRDYGISRRYVLDCSDRTNWLAPPCMLSSFDFYNMEEVTSVLQGRSTITREGDFHGSLGYFRLGLTRDVVISTSPDEPLTHWKQNFFPIEYAIMVKEGDEVCYSMTFLPVENAILWTWDTSVYRSGEKIAEFSRSDLPAIEEKLAVAKAISTPVLTQEGEIHRRILELCDARRSVTEISRLINVEYPKEYKSLEDATAEVTRIIHPLVRKRT